MKHHAGRVVQLQGSPQGRLSTAEVLTDALAVLVDGLLLAHVTHPLESECVTTSSPIGLEHLADHLSSLGDGDLLSESGVPPFLGEMVKLAHFGLRLGCLGPNVALRLATLSLEYGDFGFRVDGCNWHAASPVQRSGRCRSLPQ